MTGAAKLWWEDVGQGRTYDLGSYTMTQAEIVSFAQAYDPQPFHVDEEAARANPMFGRLCASGVHVFAVSSRVTFDAFERLGIVPIGGGGLDELRFLHPVFPGDVLTGEGEVIESRQLATRPDRGLVRMKTVLRNADGKLVLSYVGMFFLECRPANSPAH